MSIKDHIETQRDRVVEIRKAIEYNQGEIQKHQQAISALTAHVQQQIGAASELERSISELEKALKSDEAPPPAEA